MRENQSEPKDTKAAAETATTTALSQEWLERMMKKFDSDPEAQRLVDEIAALEEEEWGKDDCDDDCEGTGVNHSPFDSSGGTIYSGDSDEPEAYL